MRGSSRCGGLSAGGKAEASEEQREVMAERPQQTDGWESLGREGLMGRGGQEGVQDRL